MIIDKNDKKISVKIVYFGTALSGRTSSIKSLFWTVKQEKKILSVESAVNRTLYLDYGILACRKEFWDLVINIYTTTGYNFYIKSNTFPLKTADGIIFVVDSQRQRYDHNLSSWNDLTSYIYEFQINVPIIIAFNKQDVEDKFPPEVFLEEIDYSNYKTINVRYTIAKNGEEVIECLEDILTFLFESCPDFKLLRNPIDLINRDIY